VADEKFCETTIGCKDPQLGNEFKLLFQTVNFRFGLPTGYSIPYFMLGPVLRIRIRDPMPF
jgi:hypothetical protein